MSMTLIFPYISAAFFIFCGLSLSKVRSFEALIKENADGNLKNPILKLAILNFRLRKSFGMTFDISDELRSKSLRFWGKVLIGLGVVFMVAQTGLVISILSRTQSA